MVSARKLLLAAAALAWGFELPRMAIEAIRRAETAKVAELRPSATTTPAIATSAPPTPFAAAWKTEFAVRMSPFASATSSGLMRVGRSDLSAG